MPGDDVSKWEKRYLREKSARLQAEGLLEAKSTELYEANKQLEREILEEAKRYHIEEQKFTALFHSSVDGIILHHQDGEIIDVNNSICDLLKMTRKQLIGGNIMNLHPREEREVSANAAEKLRRIGLVRFETVMVRSEGAPLPVEISATQFEVAGETICQGIVRDISGRVEVQLELQKATTEAIKANKAKSLFLATMSHEIRTPLNGILGFTEILMDSPLSEEQKQHLDLIRRSGDMLLHIINDILDFSRLDSGKVELEFVDFDVVESIEHCIDIQLPAATAKGILLTSSIGEEVPDVLHGDASRLQQVLLNLISNGIKFTNEGMVRVVVESCGPHFIKFSVEDEGIGFDTKTKDSIFNPFEQADASTTRKYGGTGLGLAICRQLVEAMGGTIDATSTRGKGSSFHFTLPVYAVQDKEQESDLQADVLKGQRLLVIDDRIENLLLLQAWLTQWECDVTMVSSCREALQIIHEDRAGFDLFVVDMLMPEMDGFEFAREVTRRFTKRKAGMVLLSSSRLAGQRDLAHSLGYQTVLYKPLKKAILKKCLIDALMSHQAQLKKLHPNSSAAITAGDRVLLVEDNQINARLAKVLLSKEQLEVELANNGEEAIKVIADSAPFQLVLMDIQMPVMDGLQATTLIREGKAGEANKSIPIVAMTANALPEDEDRCLKVGMNGYLAKPINVDNLRKVIEKYCHQAVSS
ncbi:response regulator [Persicirhabdus sediminis]|uniref:histidine kinase n=1 Tax=Persicirhabdus sediminis TaxID=454144 RepID=A0A8J7MBJ8_9BACT|nr:response regulator [Persicirhabdus sediminis]MBK1790554.1 response regulator [Persicirhabdus sediminis]